MNEPELVETLIVGASSAGLAVAACLKRAGCPSVLLERERHVAHAWRNHYERLHLHTPKSGSCLPGLPMPRGYPRYPSRDQVVAYLESYAAHFELQPRWSTSVERVLPEGGRWRVETGQGAFLARQLVVCTGYARTPCLPSWPGQASFPGRIVHSADYSNGQPYEDQDVLVVGFGNSAGEIAIDLHEHGARPSLAVRGPVNVVPRDLLGLPILAVGVLFSPFPSWLADALAWPLIRSKVGNIEKLGLRKLPYGPFRQIREHARIPLLDIGTLRLIRQGSIAVRPGIERFEGAQVVFTDGARHAFSAVVLATGFRPDLASFLDEIPDLLDEDGRPPASGRETLPGLYFCGFHISPIGMFPEIAREARRIARTIAASR